MRRWSTPLDGGARRRRDVMLRARAVADNGACAARLPCRNGGVCRDVIDDDHVCRCPALRFTGRQCQRRQSPPRRAAYLSNQ